MAPFRAPEPGSLRAAVRPRPPLNPHLALVPCSAYEEAAAKQAPGSGGSNGFIGPRPAPPPGLPQPSLWNAFEGGRRMLQVRRGGTGEAGQAGLGGV